MSMQERKNILAQQNERYTDVRGITYADTDTGAAAGTYDVPVNAKVVYVSTAGASQNFVVRMPRAQDCPGREYVIYMTARDTTDVTVEDHRGDTGIGALASDITLDAADEYTCLKSFGSFWMEIAGNN